MKEYEDALHAAFNANFTDFSLNRKATIELYNALVTGQLVQRAMPRAFESWKDEKNRTLVAVTQDQLDALLEIRDRFGNLMQNQGKNLHEKDNSWRVIYKESVSKEECVSCHKSYNIKDMTYVEPDGIITSGQYCPICYEERYDNA